MKKGKTLASLICSVVLSLSLIVGATFALFTDSTSVNIAVTSGNVAVSASITNVKTYSGKPTSEQEYISEEREDLSFANGGSVFSDGANLEITKMASMDKVTFDIVVKNDSNIVTKYQTVIVEENGEENGLFNALDITIGGEKCTQTAWMALQPDVVGVTIPVSIELPVGSSVQNASATLICTVNAVQGNAYTEDPVIDETTQTKDYIEITSVQELKDFRDAVNSGDADVQKADVRLGANIDLANEAWTPIGPNADSANKFYGTFDGKGYKISNLTVAQDAGYHAAGLFGSLNGTVKNLTIENATITNLSSGDPTNNGTAVVAGSIYKKGKIQNVHVVNATVSGNRYVGGISGYTYGSVVDCSVSNATITATPDNLTGSYNNGDKVGGIAGYFASEGTYSVSGNTVTNLTIKGYRDIGAVVGCANGANRVTNNTVNDATITVDQNTGSYGDKDANAGAIVGRITAGALDNSNHYEKVVYSATSAYFEKLVESLAKQDGTATIVLTEDVEYATGAATGSNPFVGENDALDTLIIDGQGHKLTATGKGVGAIRSANGGKLVFKNMTIVDQSVSYAENSWEFTYLEFDGNVEFEDVDFVGGIMFQGESASFVDCSFLSEEDSVYAVWVNNGTSSFEGCTFSGKRGFKTHEAYGSEVVKITIDGCTFEDISKKPAMAIGTLNANTTLVVKNSIFKNVQPGDQNLYYYETDTNVSSFNFVWENNQLLYQQVVVSSARELTDAIANATVGTHIVFANDIVGDSIALQKENVDIIIDGAKYNYTGTIYIHGQARLNGAETLTIQNVHFVSDVERDFISSNSTESAERYAHNLTVKDCTFTSTASNEEDDVVGLRLRQTYNITIQDCTATDMHSLLWATGGNNMTVDNVTLTNCKNGLSFATMNNVVVKNSTIDAKGSYGYGIRVDASGAYKLSVENCKISASAPILMRKTTAAYEMTLASNNVLTPAYPQEENDCQIIVTKDDYAEGVALIKPEGKYVINGGYLYRIFVVAAEASTQEELNNAFSSGETAVELAAGTYTMPASSAGKTLTISGTKETVVDVKTTQTQTGGADLTFVGITIQGQTSGNYAGWGNGTEVHFIDCTINGKINLYGKKASFVNCVFNNSNDYAVWTWGGEDVIFEGCTFNSGGKALLVYGEYRTATITINNCTFKDNNTLDTQKAAIEIASDRATDNYTIIINNIKVDGFAVNPEGISTNSNIWANKNSMGTDRLNVVIDGVDVY